MNNKGINLFSVFIAVAACLILSRPLLPAADADGQVTVSGKVTYDAYAGGNITVTARSYDTQESGSPKVYVTATIPSPGNFQLKLPADCGKIFIEAANVAAEGGQSEIDSPRGDYEYNPLVIGTSDIGNVNIALSPSRAFLMDAYKGHAVTISGSVEFDDYSKGPIFIIASQDGLTYTDKEAIPVSKARIEQPGVYKLNVPENAGDIFIEAINLESGKRRLDIGDPRGQYPDNPVAVGAQDLDNIDIALKRGIKLVMNRYSGDTVTISGKVIFDKYESGPITVSASTKSDGPPDITFVEILRPGDYSISVPKNIGPVYLRAVNISARDRRPRFEIPRGQHQGNPLPIGSGSVKDIDIVISK